MIFLLSLLVFLPKVLLGFSLAHLLWKDNQISSFFLKCFLGVPLGMGISSTLLFFWKLAGLNHGGYVAVELAMVILVFTLMILKRKDSFREIKFDINKQILLENKGLLISLMISLGLSLAGFMFVLFLHPHGREDAWSNWNLIARFIYYSEDLSNAFAYLASNSFPGYPFMIGLDVASGWILLNNVTTRVPIVVSALFTFSIPGILFFALARLKDLRIASIAALLVTTPWLAQYGTFLYSDIPISVYYLATAVLITIHLNSDDTGPATLAGLTSGFAAWTKNDGLPFAMITIVAILMIAFVKKDKHVFINFCKGLALPLLAVSVYKVFFAAPGDIVTNTSEQLNRAQDFSRFKIVFEFFLSQIRSFGAPPFGLIWILLAVMLIGGIDTVNRNVIFIVFILIAQFAAYFAIYLITPLDLKWHIASSGSRVLTHLIPLLFFVIFSSLRRANFGFSQSGLEPYAPHH